jgi:hypothetical protein
MANPKNKGSVRLRIITGTENPEGNLKGIPGEIYQRRLSKTQGTLYYKASGDNTNTGWVQIGALAKSNILIVPDDFTDNKVIIPSLIGLTPMIDFLVFINAGVEVEGNGTIVNVGAGFYFDEITGEITVDDSSANYLIKPN